MRGFHVSFTVNLQKLLEQPFDHVVISDIVTPTNSTVTSRTFGKDEEATLLIWLFMVNIVSIPRDTLAGAEPESNQNEIQDMTTRRQLGM